MSKGKEIFAQLNRQGLAASYEKKRKATEAAQRLGSKNSSSNGSTTPVKLTEFLRMKSQINSQKSRLGSETSREFSTDSPSNYRVSTEQNLPAPIFDQKLEALKNFVKQNINSSKNYDIFLTMLNEINKLAAQTYSKPETAGEPSNQKPHDQLQNLKNSKKPQYSAYYPQHSFSTPSSPSRPGDIIRIQQCQNEEDLAASQYTPKR